MCSNARRELSIAVYAGELLGTNDNNDDRAGVRAVPAGGLALVGLAGYQFAVIQRSKESAAALDQERARMAKDLATSQHELEAAKANRPAPPIDSAAAVACSQSLDGGPIALLGFSLGAGVALETEAHLETLATTLTRAAKSADVWSIFDNTAAFHALGNALALKILAISD